MSETSNRAAARHATQQAVQSLSDCIEDSRIAHQALRAVTGLMLPDVPGGGQQSLNGVERGDLWALLGVISDRMSEDIKKMQAAAEKASLTL